MTKKLFNIFIILLLAFITLLAYKFRVQIKNFINDTIDKITEEEITKPDPINRRTYEYKTFMETENFKPNNPAEIKSIFYTILNNGWKEFTFYCPRKYETCSEDIKTIANDSEFVSLLNNYVSPYNEFSSFNTMITAEKEVYVSVNKLYNDEEIKQIDNKINSILKNLAIDDKNISLDDIRNLHHYLIYNVSYDKEYKDGSKTSVSNKANGALLTKKAICGGYTDAFALFMDKINIPNFKVTSSSHIWNAIYYNGTWTHVDVTWDDDEVNKNNYNNFFMITTPKLFDLDLKEHSFKEANYKELF